MQMPPLSAADMERLMYPAAHAAPAGHPRRDGRSRLRPYRLRPDGDETRFRVNLFKQRGRLSLVARRVNTRSPASRDLGLPPVLAEITQHDQGIVILAGVTGSGKIDDDRLDAAVHQRARAAATSSPSRTRSNSLSRTTSAIINQREVGIDVIDWDAALKHAVRQDPDIILVGEMRDRDTFNAAMHAAETGHLVFGTIHASHGPLDDQPHPRPVPQEMHSAMRQNLAFNLKAIIAQKLLPTTKDWAATGGRPGCRRSRSCG